MVLSFLNKKVHRCRKHPGAAFHPPANSCAGSPHAQHRPPSSPCHHLPAHLEDPGRRKPHFLTVTPAIPTPSAAHHYLAKPSPLMFPSPRPEEALHCFNQLCIANEDFPFHRGIRAVKTQQAVSGGFHAHSARWQHDCSGHPTCWLRAPACVCFSLVVVKAGGMAVIAQPDSGLDREDLHQLYDDKKNIGWSFSSKTSRFQQKSPCFSLDQSPGDSGDWWIVPLLKKCLAKGVLRQKKWKTALFPHPFAEDLHYAIIHCYFPWCVPWECSEPAWRSRTGLSSLWAHVPAVFPLPQPPAALRSHPPMGSAGMQGEGCPSSPPHHSLHRVTIFAIADLHPNSADSTCSAEGLSDSLAAPSWTCKT